MLTNQVLIFVFVLAVVIGCGIILVIVFTRKHRRENDGFRAFLVGRIMADKVLSERPPFQSKSAAVQFVATMVEKYKYAYASQNGYLAIDDVKGLCKNVVKDLHKYGIVLYSSSR